MNILKNLLRKIPKRFKNKKTVAIIIILIAILFIGSRGAADQSRIRTTTVQIKDLKLEVFATGKIESQNDSSLNFPVSGKVNWINAKEGDFIKKGQAIASLDKEKYEIALRQAQQDVVAADAVLLKTYDDLPNNETETFQEKIDRTAAEKTKNQAFDAVKLAERNLKDTVLISPIDGTLINLAIKVGDEILSTETVARVADTNSFQFAADVDESDIGGVKIDQPAILFLEAFPNEELQSSVISIGFEGELIATEATVFDVKFKIDSNDKYILGMNGDVQAITREKYNVLTVPVEALFEENRVWVKKNGSYSQRDVEVGIQNDTYAEIISGLKDGSEVVITGFDEISKKSLIQKLLPF